MSFYNFLPWEHIYILEISLQQLGGIEIIRVNNGQRSILVWSSRPANSDRLEAQGPEWLPASGKEKRVLEADVLYSGLSPALWKLRERNQEGESCSGWEGGPEVGACRAPRKVSEAVASSKWGAG